MVRVLVIAAAVLILGGVAAAIIFAGTVSVQDSTRQARERGFTVLEHELPADNGGDKQGVLVVIAGAPLCNKKFIGYSGAERPSDASIVFTIKSSGVVAGKFIDPRPDVVHAYAKTLEGCHA